MCWLLLGRRLRFFVPEDRDSIFIGEADRLLYVVGHDRVWGEGTQVDAGDNDISRVRLDSSRSHVHHDPL